MSRCGTNPLLWVRSGHLCSTRRDRRRHNRWSSCWHSDLGSRAARAAAEERVAAAARVAPGTRRQKLDMATTVTNKPHRSNCALSLTTWCHNPPPRRDSCLVHQGPSWNSPTECRRTTSRCPRLPGHLHRSTLRRRIGRGLAQRRSPRHCGYLRDRRRETGTLLAQPPSRRGMVGK